MRRHRQWVKYIQTIFAGRTVHLRIELKQRYLYVTFPNGESVKVGIDVIYRGNTVHFRPDLAAYAACDWLESQPVENIRSYLQWALGPEGCTESIAWACGKLNCAKAREARAMIAA